MYKLSLLIRKKANIWNIQDNNCRYCKVQPPNNNTRLQQIKMWHNYEQLQLQEKN